jgi:hypothetical protein
MWLNNTKSLEDRSVWSFLSALVFQIPVDFYKVSYDLFNRTPIERSSGSPDIPTGTWVSVCEM